MRKYLMALGIGLVAGMRMLLAQNAPRPAAPAAGAGAGPASIAVDATAPRVTVSPELYGIFFEEISHAGEGGLYAELVQNRDFEDAIVPQRWQVDGKTLTTPFGWKTDLWFTNELPGWSLVKQGDADGTMTRDDANPLNERNPHSLHLAIKNLPRDNTAGQIGVANNGYWGMNAEDLHWYDGSFYARTNGQSMSIGVSLQPVKDPAPSGYASTTITTSADNQWHKYTFQLRPAASDPKARLVIWPIQRPNQPADLWLDCVSLVPRNTFKGHGLRPDLAQMLVDLKPAFLRFPGGCVVEGVTLNNRIRWEDSIGDISQRKGDFELWGYYNHYGMGFHEFLQLCEDLGTQAMYVVNAGMSCQLRRPYELATDQDLHLYIEDTLNALEYAMGPATSKYGAKRVANGHPAPFKIKYVEIGNENFASNYEQHHYRAFYDAIKAAYPQVITIADTRIPMQPIEVVDDHFYVAPQRFFGLANLYDLADRKGPKIYVGEYAVNKDVGAGNLLGALSEAVFAMMMERNSDVVIMCSYAPLFENVNRADWPVNLIRFDSSRVVGRSSYYVQKLLANNRPDEVLKTEVTSGSHMLVTTEVKDLYATCGVEKKSGKLIVKVVNSTPQKISAPITFKGVKLGGNVLITTLGHADATAENTLENPHVVEPVEIAMKAGERAANDNSFTYEFSPNSLTVIRLEVVP